MQERWGLLSNGAFAWLVPSALMKDLKSSGMLAINWLSPPCTHGDSEWKSPSVCFRRLFRDWAQDSDCIREVLLTATSESLKKEIAVFSVFPLIQDRQPGMGSSHLLTVRGTGCPGVLGHCSPAHPIIFYISRFRVFKITALAAAWGRSAKGFL